MQFHQHHTIIADLRARMCRLERPDGRRERCVVPFGVPAIDGHLPDGGIVTGALHEIGAAGNAAPDVAAATLFVAGILARVPGPVLWCLTAHDLFAPGLAGVGLHPDRVIYAEAGDEKTVLLVMEEGLRHGGLAGVVGELGKLPMMAARRLQLAAEASGVLALALRRVLPTKGKAEGEAMDEPTAAVTRWRIGAEPSSPLPVASVGGGRWRVVLTRCRGGEPADWTLEACDAEGRLCVPADLADRSAAPADYPLYAVAG